MRSADLRRVRFNLESHGYDPIEVDELLFHVAEAIDVG
jgi:DivIVA domain-containing protein